MKVDLNYLTSWKDILSISPNYISDKDYDNLKNYLEYISSGK